ncbi:MAG: hypothetical protein NT013_27175 [Planctomycetia bacterium]|nr:hypothetical protein [Planctomycetia bacterium]
MNFALLGDDPAALPLIDAVQQAGHKLVRVALADTLHLRSAVVAVLTPNSWEELLIDAAVEAVIVAGDSDDVQTAAKQLASSGKPLLIVPQADFGTGCGYELSLIRDDSHVVLMPAFVHRAEVDLLSLSERLTSGELGAVRRIQIDVELPPTSGKTSLLSEHEIEAASVDDIDVLRWLGGNYDQVTSLRSGHTEQGCSQATLTLAGAGLPDAMWNVRRGDVPSWRLTVETDKGTQAVERSLLEKDHEQARKTGTPARRAPSDGQECPSYESLIPTSLIESFVAACRHEQVAQPDWSDAVRVFDVLDATRRSLRRRRTIDLHFETLSERSQFKTQMTAMGCGLLLLTLFLMLGLLGLGSMLDSRDRAVKESSAVGMLLIEVDFESRTAAMTREALARIDRIAERLKDEPKSVYLEPSDNPPSPELDQRRRAGVVERLQSRGIIAADHRTLMAPTRSSGWDTLMRVLRLAWLAPLVVFLALQILLVVAKPASPK